MIGRGVRAAVVDTFPRPRKHCLVMPHPLLELLNFPTVAREPVAGRRYRLSKTGFQGFCRHVSFTRWITVSQIMRIPTLASPIRHTDWRRHWRDWTSSLTGTWWNSRAEKWLRHTVEGLLALLLVLLLGVTLAPWLPLRARTASLRPPRGPIAEVRPTPAAMADAILAAHLFGQVPISTRVVSTAPLSITVDGIVYASQSDDSQAVLTFNGKTALFHVGQALPDGETVSAIGATDIELTGGAVARRLALPQYGNAAAEGPAAYAALLHGTGLSAPMTGSNLTRQPGAALSSPAQPFPLLPSGSPAHFVAGPLARAAYIPASATPLEQMQALREQLVHGP